MFHVLFFLAAAPILTLDLPPSPTNPRNTEGSFIRLKDGRILFAYSKFTSGTSDFATGHIAARYSSDGGMTWSATDTVLVANDGAVNVMSVSFLRLRSGEIALFTVRKNSTLDCRPTLRLSRDEGKTWSAPQPTIPEIGYYVLNNDRVIQLRSGRILIPVALHRNESDDPKRFNNRGVALVYYSDDKGKSWRRSRSELQNPSASMNGLQEPGIVELKNRRLLMFMRTAMGTQYFSYSTDRGDTWSAPEPSPLRSPLSPATIKRIPKTGDLLAIWNDHSSVPERARAVDVTVTNTEQRRRFDGLRSPLTIATSSDEGRTWQHIKSIETDPTGWYCYTALDFIGNRALLSYASGGAGLPRLSRSVIKLVDISWIYE